VKEMARALAVALLVAGCGSNDPCDGKPAACVAVKVLGSQLLDQLDVTAGLAGGRQLVGRVAEMSFTPPVQFALLLPADTVGPVEVGLVGRQGGAEVASGSGQATVTEGRGALTVRLAPLSGDLSLSPPPPDFAQDLGVSVDALPTDPTLTPGMYAFPSTLVGQRSSLTLTFYNPKPDDAVISAVQVLPAGPPVAVDGSGSCAPARAVAPGQSCTVVVSFAPLQRGQVSAEVRVSFGAAGETSSFLEGLGVAWVAEGLEQDAGSVPTFLTLWGTALDDAWTGGDHSTLFHRTHNGWMKVAVPAAATTVSSLWGVGDLWIATQTKELDHTGNGTSWMPTTLATNGNVVILWGQIDLYAATSLGEIWHLSSNWNSERSADNNAIHGLWGSDDSDVYAVSTKILHREPNGSWTPLSSTPAGDHNAVWGSAAGDVWFAGCDGTGSGCGFLKHLENNNLNKVTTPRTDALYGLWGSSQNDIFAVGKSGAILHYDGSIWSSETSSTSADLRAVWGAGGEVFAVGAGGTILHRY
jgi:hypothetical protein